MYTICILHKTTGMNSIPENNVDFTKSSVFKLEGIAELFLMRKDMQHLSVFAKVT